MKSMIKELWHGNIVPGEDSRNNSKEMKQPSSNTPSASEQGSQWRCRRTKNNNKTANQASVKYPMPSCLAHTKVNEKKRLELFTVL